MVDKKYIKNLQGKDFVLFEGLLDEAHNKKLRKIETQLVSSDNGIYIFKAQASFWNDGSVDYQVYEAHGDASKDNVSGAVAKHLIRMAETRAIARALRLGTNIGMCSTVEVGEDPEEPKEPSVTSAPCEECKKDITSAKIIEYSTKKHGKVLCLDCQKKDVK